MKIAKVQTSDRRIDLDIGIHNKQMRHGIQWIPVAIVLGKPTNTDAHLFKLSVLADIPALFEIEKNVFGYPED